MPGIQCDSTLVRLRGSGGGDRLVNVVYRLRRAISCVANPETWSDPVSVDGVAEREGVEPGD